MMNELAAIHSTILRRISTDDIAKCNQGRQCNAPSTEHNIYIPYAKATTGFRVASSSIAQAGIKSGPAYIR